MSRYKDIFNLTKSTNPVPNITIKDRESDIYLEYQDWDNLTLISNRIYESPEYWWIILKANGYQIEFDIESGEVLRVPYPLSEVLDEIKGQL